MAIKTFSFPQMVGRDNKKVTLSENNKSINECLGILLRTRPGEMLGDPNYGCLLIERIFSYQGLVVEQLIKEDIVNAINAYEPRITVTYSDIQIVYDATTVRIYLNYTINQTGKRSEYEVDVSTEDNPYL